VDTPMAMPPMNLAIMKDQTSCASADQDDPTRKSAPTQSSVFFLPNRSVGQPPPIEPNTVPHKAAPMASPCMASLSPQSDWIVFSAPEMTTVSKPNRKPASAATRDQSTRRAFMDLVMLMDWQ